MTIKDLIWCMCLSYTMLYLFSALAYKPCLHTTWVCDADPPETLSIHSYEMIEIRYNASIPILTMLWVLQDQIARNFKLKNPLNGQ